MRHLFSVLFFVWLAALLALTYYPDLPETKIRIREEWFRLDYIGHAGFYALLMLFFLMWQKSARKKLRTRYVVLAAAYGILFGALTEATQHFIPGRSVNPYDLMYNCLGIVTGIVIFQILIQRTRILTSNSP